MLVDKLQSGDWLVQHGHTLLETMPEMVFLIQDNFVITYQNRSGYEQFGDLCGKKCSRDLQKICMPCLENDDITPRPQSARDTREAVFYDVPVEYSLVPFQDSRGDRLLMVMMRDISIRKEREHELVEFNKNIELILGKIVGRLKKSEASCTRLSRQVDSLKSQLGFCHEANRIIGSSQVMRELREMIQQVATSDATILITGESGTGKELVANMIKASSNRNGMPFVKVNCNAMNDALLERDLFGYENQVVAGVSTSQKGKFEVVNGGTIFLDEIGSISPRMQASLLRVLQNGEIVRVGGTEPVRVDVRIIAATNVNLAEAVKNNTFRMDLYYRLNIINIDIPPLRERKEDILELVTHFVHYYRTVFKKEVDFEPQSIINRLMQHDWPGNVRELENLIQRAVLMARGKLITAEDLFFDQNLDMHKNTQPLTCFASKIGLQPLKGIMAEFEGLLIRQALEKCTGSVSRAAQELQIGKTALYDKLKRYNISAKAIKNECRETSSL